MRPVGTLDVGIAAIGEPEGPAIAGTRDVDGLARHQSLARRPGSEELHGGRQLGEVGLGYPFEVLDASLAPLLHVRRREPADAHQHVDHADGLTRRQGGLGRSNDTLLSSLVAPPC